MVHTYIVCITDRFIFCICVWEFVFAQVAQPSAQFRTHCYCSRLTFKAALLRFYNFYHTLTHIHTYTHTGTKIYARTHLKAKICVKFRRRRFLLFCCVCEVLKVRQIKYNKCVLVCVCLYIDFIFFGMFCWKRLCSFLLQFVFSLKSHFKLIFRQFLYVSVGFVRPCGRKKSACNATIN